MRIFFAHAGMDLSLPKLAAGAIIGVVGVAHVYAAFCFWSECSKAAQIADILRNIEFPQVETDTFSIFFNPALVCACLNYTKSLALADVPLHK